MKQRAWYGYYGKSSGVFAVRSHVEKTIAMIHSGWEGVKMIHGDS
jgi:hypothetical protein